MYSGPYNSPLELARRPWGALFWAVWAIYLIPAALMALINLLVPGSVESVFESTSPEAYHMRWVLLLAGHALVLVVMMIWGEHVGIGPFAGRMQSEPSWVMLGVIGGPVLFFVISAFATVAFSGGNENWHIQEGLDPQLFSLETGGPALIAVALFIAPLMEEIAYRGIGLGYFLAKGWTPLIGVVVVTMVWTLSHTQYTPFALIPIFAFGLFLAWLRIRSGSMIAPIAAHIAVNTSQLALPLLS